MKEYVLDANAILRYLGVSKAEGEPRIRELFQLAELGQAQLFVSAINLGEVYYILLREVGERTAREQIPTLRKSVITIGVDEAGAIEAASLKHFHKIGYADSFAAALALGRKATLVSADPVFEKFGKSLKWMRMPAYVSNSNRKSRHN